MMRRRLNPNLHIIIAAANRLGELRDDMVFIGGCAVGLLITDLAAPEVRITIDVDVIVEVASRVEFYRLEDELRGRGFRQVMLEEAPVCRWHADDVILDVMPTDPQILGFGNRWYAPSLENAISITLHDDVEVNMITAPYFLATKMEAFLIRGNGDCYGSHDLEDIIVVIDGRPELVDEIRGQSADLKDYLAMEFNKLVKDESFMDALPGHLPPSQAGQDRLGIIMDRLHQIVSINTEESE